MKKIWIYQANRFLDENEQQTALRILDGFVKDWTAHGNRLAGTAAVYHNLFFVLQVDEAVAQVTGCSIDKSVHLLKEIERTLNLSLFDRMSVAYRDSDGNVAIADKATFQSLIAQGTVTADTPVFNNMVSDGQYFPEYWEVPLRDSWHFRVFM